MKKFLIGLVVGAVIGFPLGINFGKDVPLLSNPFAAKPDIPDRMIERAGQQVEELKGAVHEATRPAQEALRK